MKNRVWNNSGLSLIDALIAMSLLAFFVAFLPQVLTQTQKLYFSATKRSEMDRTRQVMMIAAKNVTRIKRNIQHTIESEGKSYDRLMNCFGQKGPNQTQRLPGTNCKGEFGGDAWRDLLEAPVNGVQQNLFWGSWSAGGACNPGDEKCLMNTWSKYNVSCSNTQCYGVHLMLGITPTDTMMAMQNVDGRGGFSSQDFKEQKMQMTMPGSMYGVGRAVANQNCDTGLMSQLDLEYGILYCNREIPAVMGCGTSVHTLGSDACYTGSFEIQARGAKGSVQPTAVDVAPGGAVNANLRLCAEVFGTLPPDLIPHATDPLNQPPTPVQVPFFNAAAGDRIHFSCAPPVGTHIFSAPGCQNISVARNTFSAPSSIGCYISVITVTGSTKGSTGTATLQVINSAESDFDTGGPPTTAGPGGTVEPQIPRDVDSNGV